MKAMVDLISDRIPDVFTGSAGFSLIYLISDTLGRFFEEDGLTLLSAGFLFSESF